PSAAICSFCGARRVRAPSAPRPGQIQLAPRLAAGPRRSTCAAKSAGRAARLLPCELGRAAAVSAGLPAVRRSVVMRQGADSATARYLDDIGVPETPRATCPFDPGYDPGTLEGHMAQ